MSFHYNAVFAQKLFCPVPLAFGPSGTGKTIVLHCALALFGAHMQHIYQRCTLQYYASRCAECSIPFGNEHSELLPSISNNTERATVTHGSNQPQSSPMISADLSLQDKATMYFIGHYVPACKSCVM